MTKPSISSLEKRRANAQKDRDIAQPMLDDAYAYAIPYRKSARDGKGQSRVDKIFDHTATTSAFRGAGRLQQDLCPPGEAFLQIVPGIAAELAGGKQLEDLSRELENISKVVSALTLDGEWDQAFIEMAIDLQAGTGVMFVLPHETKPKARFVACALDDVLLEQGPYNDIVGVFWTREWSIRAIVDAFKGSATRWPAAMALLEKTPEKLVQLHQDVVWDPAEERWHYVAWFKDSSDTIQVRYAKTRTKPVLTPRYHRITGEVYGRGPINLALPTIKTLNTAQKLTLQAAAIAMLGIYTAVDDGVFNPDLSPIEPAAFWKVARNGGVLGPSVSRFPDPRIDVSNIVLQELRLSVQSAMNDQTLPPDGAAVKSATEIMERVKRLASDHIGAYGRFVNEIMVPLGERLIEIAYDKQLIVARPTIDQLLVKVKVNAPIAEAREFARVQRIVQWLEMVVGFAGVADPDEAAKVTEALVFVGRTLGVDSKFIVTSDERVEVKKNKAEQQAMAALAAAAAAGGGAAPGGVAPGGDMGAMMGGAV